MVVLLVVPWWTEVPQQLATLLLSVCKETNRQSGMGQVSRAGEQIPVTFSSSLYFWYCSTK